MKYKLELEFDYSFLLFGISCHDSSHRLCWYLNRALGLRLGMTGEHEVPHRGERSKHLLYQFASEDTEERWSLLSNHSENGMVAPELKQFDYLLKVEEDDQVDISEVLEKIRNIPLVIACYTLDANTLKSRDNLIFD